MNPEHLSSLKQAAELIKSGKTKPARGIIIEILRSDPDNAQAWYMLSFAVPRVDKQIYALQQTIRLMPDHQKAIDRLKSLGGEIPRPSSEKTVTEIPSHPIGEHKALRDDKATSDSPEVDLLSQRLFGEELPKKDSAPQKDRQVSKPPVFYHEIAEQGSEEKEDHPSDNYEELIEDDKKINIFGIPRNIFYIGLSIIIVAIIIITGFSPQLIDLIRNSSPVQQAGINTLESIAQTTNTSIPEPSPISATPTLSPSPTSTPEIQTLFNTSDLIPPSDDILIQIENIQTEIQPYLTAGQNPNPTVFSVSESRLQTLIWDFAKLDGFNDQVGKNQKIFEILGLAEPGDDFSSFYQNYWVDPNGTLYLPDTGTITIAGFEFSEYQKYSYAQAYVQAVREQQNLFDELNLYPPCLELSQTCEVNLALLKGEAAFTAWQWASGTYDEETLNKIEQTTKKIYFVPVFSPPDVMEAIRLFPYEKGFSFVLELSQQDGWESVDALYSSPPTTTEQILHPEKYLSGEVGAEIIYTDLSSVLSEEWEPIFQESLGEWKTYLMFTASNSLFAKVNPEEALVASSGWNGDHTQIFTSNSGRNLVSAHWKFDSSSDKEEFLSTLSQYASKRIAGETVEISNIPCINSAIQISCITEKELDVLWVLGPDSQTVETILENYTFFQE